MYEVGVWAQKNIAPYATASQSSVIGDRDATKAQTPVPIVTHQSLKDSATQNTNNPWWGLDLGLPRVPIKDVLLIQNQDAGGSHSDYWVRVGDVDSPYLNPSCNTAPINIVAGKDVSCDLAGRYLSVVR